jgi:hypothetical protein
MRDFRAALRSLLVAGALTALSSSTSLAQNAAPSFTLTLSGGLRDKSITEFRAGSKIWITIIQKNLTSHPIDCTEITKNGVDSSYRYDVRDEDGNVTEKLVRSHMELDPADIHPCNLAAGESLTGETQISRVYKFDRPGKYVIQVSRFDPDVKDDEGNPLKVLSNTVTITIAG